MVEILVPVNKTETTQYAHLPNDRALENDQHEQCEQAVVPVFVQTPKCDTEHLKDEEWCGRVLTEESTERWDGDIELVLAK